MGLALALAGCLTACSSGPRPAGDAVLDLRNPNLKPNQRMEAVERAWTSSEGNPRARTATRSAMKDLVWSPATPHELRAAIYQKLIDDPDPAAAADARTMTRLMLPRERSRAMVYTLSMTAAERGWTECVPALVRSYSRPVEKVEEGVRAERVALQKLVPDRPIAELAYEYFLNPPAEESPDGQAPSRMRADAWDLLARLDSDGALRKKLLETSTPGDPNDDVVRVLRRALADLRAVPTTGDQLRWLMRLSDEKNPANAAWWAEAKAAVGELPPSDHAGAQLRHAEAVRFARAQRPELLARSRAELLSELRQRLAGRSLSRRTTRDETNKPTALEGLDDWKDRLTRLDLITILLLDDAVRDPAVTEQLFLYASMDTRDETTEYGGAIGASRQRPGQLIPQLFPPRPGQRMGDDKFVASDDMLNNSDTALAHYHFHVQREENRGYSGPSSGDLEYADRFGRACLVLTGLSRGVLNVDYYQPGGIVIDLGELRRADPERR